MGTRSRRPSRRNFQYILLSQLSHDISVRAVRASINQSVALHAPAFYGKFVDLLNHQAPQIPSGQLSKCKYLNALQLFKCR